MTDCRSSTECLATAWLLWNVSRVSKSTASLWTLMTKSTSIWLLLVVLPCQQKVIRLSLHVTFLDVC